MNTIQTTQDTVTKPVFHTGCFGVETSGLGTIFLNCLIMWIFRATVSRLKEL